MTLSNRIIAITIFFWLALNYPSNSLANTLASFDCNKASTATEKAICHSPELSKLDGELAAVYKRFVGGLANNKKQTAKQMQRNWIINRDRRCYKFKGKISKKFETMDGKISTGEECLKEIYLDALTALGKGALISHYYLFDSMESYDIKLAGIPKIIKKSSRANVLGEDTDQTSYFIKLADREILLDQTETLAENANNGTRKEFIEIRTYMEKGGRLYNSLVENYSYWGGRCGDDNGLRIKFFNVEDKYSDKQQVNFYRVPGTAAPYISLSTYSGSCGGSHSEVYDWGVDKGTLYFDDLFNTSWYYWAKFPMVKRYTVLNSAYQVSEPVNKSLESFNSEPFRKIYKDVFVNVQERVIANECDRIKSHLSAYYQVKGAISRKGVSQLQALYTASALLNRLDEFPKVAAFVPTINKFLIYLDEIKTVENWEKNLVEASKKYPQPNHNYFKNDAEWQVNPFVKNGFDSASSCISTTRSIESNMSLEEWIYAFWARRVEDGSLIQTETILRAILKNILVEDVAVENKLVDKAKDILIEGVGIGGIVVGKSRTPDVILAFGNDYRLVRVEKNHTQISYDKLGLSFYARHPDPQERIYSINAEKNFSGKTTKGIVTNKSTMQDVVDIYGPAQWVTTNSSKTWWLSYTGTQFHVEKDKSLPTFPLNKEVHLRKKIVEIRLVK